MLVLSHLPCGETVPALLHGGAGNRRAQRLAVKEFRFYPGTDRTKGA